MASIKLTYQGTNTLILQKESSTLLIDPHYSRPSLLELMSKIHPNRQRIADGLDAGGIDQLDGVLLTHTHYDHALDAPEVIHLIGGRLYGSQSTANIAKGAGLKHNQFCTASPGVNYTIGGLQISFHPARHISFPPPLKWLLPESGEISQPLSSPAWFWRYRCGDIYAIQIDHILIFGSAGFIPGAYMDLDVDTVILGIGGLETKSHTYLNRLYAETVVATGAEQVFLTHWDHFFRSFSDAPGYLGLAKRTIKRIQKLGGQNGQSVRVLPFRETILIDNKP